MSTKKGQETVFKNLVSVYFFEISHLIGTSNVLKQIELKKKNLKEEEEEEEEEDKLIKELLLIR